MANFDERLIDPDEKRLARALGKAMTAANRELKRGHRGTGRANSMERDAAFWGRFARDVLKGGAEGRRRSCKGGTAVPEVVTGWWTDPAGRKHVRVIGRTRQRWTRLRGEVEMRSLPPWWHVYPEAVLGVRGKKDGERYLAVCRCGAVGAPEALGWMGDSCGPCFDRRAEGGAVSGGFGQFAGWAAHMPRFAFARDTRALVGQNLAGAYWKVDRDTGAAVVGKRRGLAQFADVATDAGGLTILANGGSVYRWRDGEPDVENLIGGRGQWCRSSSISPDGTRAVLVSYRESWTADLTAAKPKWVHGPTPDTLFAFRYAPDGRLLATSNGGAVCAVEPETMGFEVLRSDAYDGTTWSGPAPGLVVAPDGAAVLLLRTSYARRGTSVRHVPLTGGKVVEMRVPDWHRASSLAYSPDGRFAVTAEAESGWVGFFEVASGKAVGFVRAVMEDTAWRSGHLEFAPDGTAVAVSYNGAYDHGATVAVWPWPDAMLAAGA